MHIAHDGVVYLVPAAYQYSVLLVRQEVRNGYDEGQWICYRVDRSDLARQIAYNVIDVMT